MWQQAYLETRILSADPMELVCLLYQHAIEAVRDARSHMRSGNIAKRSEAISKTIGIIGELNVSLDHSTGSVISGNLEQLYGYMTARLTEANVRKQEAPLAEVESLLTTLSAGWQQAREQQAPAARPPVEQGTKTWQESGNEQPAHAWSA